VRETSRRRRAQSKSTQLSIESQAERASPVAITMSTKRCLQAAPYHAGACRHPSPPLQPPAELAQAGLVEWRDKELAFEISGDSAARTNDLAGHRRVDGR
jgi:hypothetical protein